MVDGSHLPAAAPLILVALVLLLLAAVPVSISGQSPRSAGLKVATQPDGFGLVSECDQVDGTGSGRLQCQFPTSLPASDTAVFVVGFYANRTPNEENFGSSSCSSTSSQSQRQDVAFHFIGVFTFSCTGGQQVYTFFSGGNGAVYGWAFSGVVTPVPRIIGNATQGYRNGGSSQISATAPPAPLADAFILTEFDNDNQFPQSGWYTASNYSVVQNPGAVFTNGQDINSQSALQFVSGKFNTSSNGPSGLPFSMFPNGEGNAAAQVILPLTVSGVAPPNASSSSWGLGGIIVHVNSGLDQAGAIAVEAWPYELAIAAVVGGAVAFGRSRARRRA